VKPPVVARKKNARLPLMSLPPGFIDELRTRVSLSSIVGKKVTWDMRKSNLGKGDMWAPCPFHQEKSASFHVDDRKGYYYCFGCHAKGDAVSFVKETDNVGFMEAVEILAREAGMTMPARDPRSAEKADHRTQLVQVMEEAVKWFRLQLRTTAASEARDYLARRKLTPEAQDRWEIGFAPDQRTALLTALTQKGIAPDLIVAAGLCARADDGSIYDRFRGRIIFPIRDGRGRAISLGGRAMDPNARAKYLNGPETDLFDKGRNLYNHAPAREAAGKGAPLIVAEGYMDVIALSEAGFKATVAPLGTAVTEDQLRLMWRIHPAPIIALDGDAAGQRAAARVIDLALPVIESGQELLFAQLPTGQDPDDLLHSSDEAEGKRRMEEVIATAKPMADVLWLREASNRSLDTPERVASLKKTLRELVNRIKDKDIRGFYKYTFTQKLNTIMFSMGRAARTGKSAEKLLPRPQTKNSLLATTSAWNVIELIRELAILAVLFLNRQVVTKFESGLEGFEMRHYGHAQFLSAVLKYHRVQPDTAYHLAVSGEIGRDRVDAVLTHTHVKVVPAVKRPDDFDLASATVEEQMAFLSADRGHRREIEDSELDMDGLVDEGLTWRLNRVNEAVRVASRFGMESEGDADEDRAALSKHLQNLIDGQVWLKKSR
jgi:DNA primase